MNEKIGATIDKTKGRIKEEVGYATGDDKLAAKGLIDRVKGAVKNKVAELKEDAKKRADSKIEKMDKKSA